MAIIWHKTNFLGVRYREHNRRKHGVRFDRCFSIRYKLNGKDKEEVAGWGSEGMTAEKAFNMLSVIRENMRLGREPCSIAAMRQANESKRVEDEKAQRRTEKEQVTLADFWEAEYFLAAQLSKTPKSVAGEKSYYDNWIKPALGNVPLQKIDAAKVEALVRKVQKAGRSPATVRYVMAIISQVWNKAATRNVVQGESPTRKIKKPRQDNRRSRFLSKDEAVILLDALKARSWDLHDEALISLFCGLRAGEIYALTWGDIDFENEIIHIKDTKNKHNRHAFMTQEVQAMLEQRHKGQTKNAFVFPASDGSQRRWTSDTFARTVDSLDFNNTGEYTKDDKGEPVPVKISDARQKVVFHTLRHTFASWLVQNGTPLYTVAELMGHTTLEMTRRYSHLAPDTLRKAAISLQGSLLEQKPRLCDLNQGTQNNSPN